MPAPANGGVGLRWGVEPTCAVLVEHGIKISPSTYYEWIAKKSTRQQLHDAEVTQLLRTSRMRLGSRKMWIKLRGQGHEVARYTVAAAG